MKTFILLLFLSTALGLRIKSKDYFYNPSKPEYSTLQLTCGDPADLSQTRIRYLLGDSVIFDSQALIDTANFVINLRDGQIELVSRNRVEGFSDLSCERDGIVSENKITIFALTDVSIKVTPSRFRWGDELEMECLHTIAPQTNLQYIAQMWHASGTCAQDSPCVFTQFLKYDYDSDKPESNKGTQIYEDSSQFFDLVAGKDKSRMYGTVTLWNKQKSQGRFYCVIGMEDSRDISNVWSTYDNEDNGQVITTTTKQPTTSPPTPDPNAPVEISSPYANAGYFTSSISVGLSCGRSEYNSTKLTRYFLGDDVIFDSRKPYTSGEYQLIHFLPCSVLTFLFFFPI